jgi:hypothetical protein
MFCKTSENINTRGTRYNQTLRLCFISFYIKSGISWWSIVDIKDCQQVPPSFPFASPLAIYYDGLGVATMLSRLKSTHAFKQEFSSELESIILTFKLTYITSDNGAS